MNLDYLGRIFYLNSSKSIESYYILTTASLLQSKHESDKYKHKYKSISLSTKYMNSININQACYIIVLWDCGAWACGHESCRAELWFP